jgi:hypothetical protein
MRKKCAGAKSNEQLAHHHGSAQQNWVKTKLCVLQSAGKKYFTKSKPYDKQSPAQASFPTRFSLYLACGYFDHGWPEQLALTVLVALLQHAHHSAIRHLVIEFLQSTSSDKLQSMPAESRPASTPFI